MFRSSLSDGYLVRKPSLGAADLASYASDNNALCLHTSNETIICKLCEFIYLYLDVTYFL